MLVSSSPMVRGKANLLFVAAVNAVETAKGVAKRGNDLATDRGYWDALVEVNTAWTEFVETAREDIGIEGEQESF